MNPTRLFTRTITITHVTANPANPDEYGNPGETTTTTTALGEIQQRQRSEPAGLRSVAGSGDSQVQDETWVLMLEPSATVAGADRITVNGDAYELKGPPWRARSPRTGVETHIEATVRRTT